MKSTPIVRVAVLCPLFAAVSEAEEFGGIEFPQGVISFADQIVSYTPGSPGPTHPNFTSPQMALGPPDYSGTNRGTGSVSLGVGGVVVLEFTNNVLTGSGDATEDLHIFEIGSDVEDTFVEISTDGVLWHDIGKVSGSISSIDIDAFGFTPADQFRFVRLTDDPDEGMTTGETVGADIDAVGAIATVQIDDDPVLVIRNAGNTSYAETLESQGALAHWRLHECSGATAANFGSLGAAADGTYGVSSILGAPGLRAGTIDSAMQLPFKSTETRLVVTGFAMPTDALTVTFLVQGEDDGTSFFFGYGAESEDNEINLGSDNGSLFAYIQGSRRDFSGADDVLDGSVHHVALTWTESTGLLEVFVDGQFSSSATVAAGSPLATGGVLALAQDLDNLVPPDYGFDANQSLVGTIDEVAVFDRVLSPSEIEAQHTAATTPGTPSSREFFLEFPSAFGSTYTIRESPDLVTWSDLFINLPGTGGKIRLIVEGDAPRNFFRFE